MDLLLATAERLEAESEEEAARANQETPMEYGFLAGIGLRKGLRGKQRRKAVLLDRQLAHLREAAGILDEEQIVAEALFDLANMMHEPGSNGFHQGSNRHDGPRSGYNQSRQEHQRRAYNGTARHSRMTPQRRRMDEDEDEEGEDESEEDYNGDGDAGGRHQQYYQQQHPQQRPHPQRGEDWDDGDGEEEDGERGYRQPRQRRGMHGGRSGPSIDAKRQRGWHGDPVYGNNTRNGHAQGYDSAGQAGAWSRRSAGGKLGQQTSSSPEHEAGGDVAAARRASAPGAALPNGTSGGGHAKPPVRMPAASDQPGARAETSWQQPQQQHAPATAAPAPAPRQDGHRQQDGTSQQQQQPPPQPGPNAPPRGMNNMHPLGGMPPQMLQMLQHMGKLCMATLPNGMTVPVVMGPEGQMMPVTGWPGMNPFFPPALAAKMMTEGGAAALGHMAQMAQQQAVVAAGSTQQQQPGQPAKGTVAGYAGAAPSGQQHPVQGHPATAVTQQQQPAGARAAAAAPGHVSTGAPGLPQQQAAQQAGQTASAPAAGITAGVPAQGWPAGGSHAVGGVAGSGMTVPGGVQGGKRKGCLLHVQIAHWIHQRQKQAQQGANDGASGAEGPDGTAAARQGARRASVTPTSSESGGAKGKAAAGHSGGGGSAGHTRAGGSGRGVGSDGEQSTSAANEAGHQPLHQQGIKMERADGTSLHPEHKSEPAGRQSNGGGSQWRAWGKEEHQRGPAMSGNGVVALGRPAAASAPAGCSWPVKQETGAPAGPDDASAPAPAAAPSSPTAATANGRTLNPPSAAHMLPSAGGPGETAGEAVVAHITRGPPPVRPAAPAGSQPHQPRPPVAPPGPAPAQGLPYGMPPQAALLCALILQQQNAAAMAGRGMPPGAGGPAPGVPAGINGAPAMGVIGQPMHREPPQLGVPRGAPGPGGPQVVQGMVQGAPSGGLPQHLAMLAGAQAAFLSGMPGLAAMQQQAVHAMQQQGMGYPVPGGAPPHQLKQAGGNGPAGGRPSGQLSADGGQRGPGSGPGSSTGGGAPARGTVQ